MDKLNINDDTYENDNDDSDNDNDNYLMNFTSLAKFTMSKDNESNSNGNQIETNQAVSDKDDKESINNQSIVFQRKSFRDYVEYSRRRDYEECLKFINSTQVLSHLEESDKSILVQSMKIKTFEKNICILKSDEKVRKMFFVKEGLLRYFSEDFNSWR